MITIDATNETTNETTPKADLWMDRIHAFQESGLSRKDWCLQNKISQSTLSYWIRKFRSEDTETECMSEPVFAKLPSEREIQSDALMQTQTSPVTILLPENIRIEVGADCPECLLTALLHAIKSYA